MLVLNCAEETNEKSLEKLVHRAAKEGIQWGLVAGTYSGVNYGLQQALGENNWVSLFPQFGLSVLYTAKVLQKLFFNN
jgi:hypothetical protein